MHRSRLHACFILPALVAAAIAGCSPGLNPVAPADHDRTTASTLAGASGAPGETDCAPRDFYPLALGNRWSFDLVVQIRSGPPGGPLGDPVKITESQVRELVCRETAGDLSYVVEETRATQESGSSTWWVRYRQDPRGLYEKDVSVSTPPECGLPALTSGMQRIRDEGGATADLMAERIEAAVADPARRAATLAAWRSLRERLNLVSRSAVAGLTSHPGRGRPGGVAEGEITRLTYPLHRGAKWIIRDDPRFEVVVEGLDVVRTPAGAIPAWRLRLENEFLGPRDRVHQWVSRQGFVKMAAHFEFAGADENGQPRSYALDSVERLTGLEIARPRAPETSPMEPVAKD
jgi:hypothetical protein